MSKKYNTIVFIEDYNDKTVEALIHCCCSSCHSCPSELKEDACPYYEKNAEELLADHLAQWDMGVYEDDPMKQPWGDSDTVKHLEDGFVLTYNFGLGYASLFIEEGAGA